MSNPCQFKPFPLATGICDTCGKKEKTLGELIWMVAKEGEIR